jgi:hypothetical protein
MKSPGIGPVSLSASGGSALALHGAPAFLVIQAALAGGFRRGGGAAPAWRLTGFGDPRHQPFDGVIPVLLLRAEPSRLDDQDAGIGEPACRKEQQPFPDLGRQRRRAPNIKAESHRRGDLVDILPARPGGAEEFEPKLVG